MTKDITSPDTFNHVYARDRAAVVAVGIICIVREAPDDREACARVAEVLRFEFADIERQAFADRQSSD
jgi:hypothetical protein